MHYIDQPMPVGAFVRRRLDQEFKPVKRERYELAFHWLEYLNHTKNLNIQHKLNHGKERRIFKYPVDGFDEITNTAYQRHGCYWHGHQCWLTRNITDQKWMETRENKFRKTRKISSIIKALGYNLVEMYECNFRTQMRFNSKLKAFIDARKPTMVSSSITEGEILQKIKENKLFGMVEVDISVPDQWPVHFSHPTLTPYQYFAEMSPLFCTTEVPFEAIGQHMQQHVQNYNLSQKPRKLLVGGIRARKILLATPLLKWYLEHGLQVTKVYQTVEFQKQTCFRQFVKDVTNARRVGDIDKFKTIIADTRKLEGNSAYGSTIMDQEKFQSVKYVRGEGNAMLEANLPEFKKITTLIEEDEYYEVEKRGTAGKT
ncbi:hypothetical protein KUTeg_014618 [Tegillarca granosa]|uniref:Uncharacterized protein n=1 Tax=Tegillarca granosa TaxID=220873 RepID=A0ABQ9ERP7_TEGGR|nr:hypothetical protein KUTeg_014618 [Tegillarca granosa]